MRYRVLALTIFSTAFISSASSEEYVEKNRIFEISKKPKESNQELSKTLYQEAKRISVDALPGEQDRAEKLLIESIRMDPKNINSYLELAKVIHNQISMGNKPPHEIHKSIQLVNQAYELDPERPRTRFLSAEFLYQLGQTQSAEFLYAETIAKYPNHRETLIEKAKSFADKNPSESLALLEKAIQNGSPIDDVSQQLSALIIKINQKENLPESLKSYAKKYNDRWLWHKAGLAYANNKKYKEATISFEKAIALGNNIESRLQLAVMQYAIEGKYNESVKNFELLINSLLVKKEISRTAYSLVYAHLSLAYFKDKDIKNAGQAALFSAKLGSQNKQFYASLVSEYKRLNSLYVLEDSLKYLLKNDPSYELTYTIYAEIYRNQNKLNKAIEMYDKAISLDPKRDDLFAERAITYYRLSAFENALVDFEQAIKLTPNNAIYIYNKACMLALLGKKSEALENLKLAFIEDKNLINLAKEDSDFYTIKSDSHYASQFATLILENIDDK